MYNLLLCDDNEVFLSETEKMIKNTISDIGCNIVSLKNPADAVDLIREGIGFDIAVLDIEMPEKNGIDLAKEFNEKFPDCRIIYLTNHIVYVSDVYETNHTYFVLKEDMDKKLPPAIFKAIDEITRQKNDFIILSSKNKKIVVRISDILYCERYMRTTEIVTSQKSVSVSQNLDEIFERLKNSSFTRCHKSFIVNMDKVSEIFRNKYVFESGKEVPISRSFSDITKTDFAKFMCRGV